MNKLILLFLITSLIAFNAYASGNIAPKISSGEIFCKQYQTIPEFSSERYSWVEHGSILRFPSPLFGFSEIELGETICYLENQKLKKIIVSIYNRGDCGEISDKAFEEKLRIVFNVVHNTLNGEAQRANRKSDTSRSTYDIGGMLFKNDHVQVLVEYSVKNIGAKTVPAAEYIRMTIMPIKILDEKKSIRNLERKKPLRDNVIALSDGGKVISGIPMVDQGQKGYCAAATVARVMGYYGYEQLDQHQIAQWAKTDSSKGTSIDEMMNGIRRVLHDTYKLNIMEFEKMETKDFFKLVERYNVEAKKQSKQTIELLGLGVIDVGMIYHFFDPIILKTVQIKNKQKNDIFFNRIKAQIDKGVPLVWSVQLGIFPEQGLPQSRGGHMRLIIGYGGRTVNDRYIMFSDSWGAGHEQKKMPLDEAITITTGLLVIAPRLN
ncbi:MAG: hypothetical protein J6V41_01050 [Kiritimatiellae bacterium]|nr:hypothetical protein [Kiritimatiellia bacterium]